MATALCPDEFTIGKRCHAYQMVGGEQLDPWNCRRKVAGSPGFLYPTGRTTPRQVDAPPSFSVPGRRSVLLNPPMVRGVSGRGEG